MSLVNYIKRYILIKKELRSIKTFNAGFIGFESRDISNNLHQIRQEHKRYIQSVSSPEMALSVELSEFIYRHCLFHQPKKILDIGSGFSSYVLRLYKKSSPGVVVFSVDDNRGWLIKTESYLLEHNLSTGKLFSLDNFIDLNHEDLFDFILLDLNFVEIRKDYLQFSIDLLSEKGFLIIDDAHKVEFLREIKKTASRCPGFLYSLKKQTIDAFGRFSLIYKNVLKC